MPKNDNIEIIDENPETKPETDTKAESEPNPEPQASVVESSPEADSKSKPAVTKSAAEAKSGGKISGWWKSYLAHKKRNIPLTILGLVAILLLIPFTRYEVLGLFMQSQFQVTVVDSTTNEPVTSANVSLAGHTTTTDKDGKATITSKVGHETLKITKKYYADFSQKVLVSTSVASNNLNAKLQATGRQVPVSVTNKITGQGVEGVAITVAGTEARTDKDGTVTVVLPPDQKTADATLSAKGYNDTKAVIQITDQTVAQNKFTITPVGKLYFLSKASGKIDVVKTNLDGTDRQTVLAGTGNEEDAGTVLLASRDWKYLALLSRRSGKLPKLYLINTSNDKLTTIDEGDASFTLTGWSNHFIVYTVYRNGYQVWQPKQQALKSYDADNNKLTILDQTAAEGNVDYDYAAETFGNIFETGGKIVYTKNWNGDFDFQTRIANNQAQILSVSPNGNDKTVVKKQGISSSSTTDITFSGQQYAPNGIYFQAPDGKFYKYEDGSLTATTAVNQDSFYNTVYNTYLASPSGTQTFWYEERDGKNTLFIGDANGKAGKIIGSLTDYTTYGWYTDDYLLVSKKDSELYIMAKGKITDNQPLKVSDYHKPDDRFFGYGGGYGGI